jgi:hypothetical protein
MKNFTLSMIIFGLMLAFFLLFSKGPVQAGERIMQPEFGLGQKGVDSTPVVTGPAGEEIDEEKNGENKPKKKKIPGHTPEWTNPKSGDPGTSSDEESGQIGFGDGVRGRRLPSGASNGEGESASGEGKTKSQSDIKLKGKKILEN